jgi:dTDP-4-dehydrorhamnose reductase
VSPDSFQQQPSLELWGGAECTINRVREDFFEQLSRTGHLRRVSDFDRFAQLGIKALRQPILWECTPSHESEEERWRWADVALRRLAERGIRPIVGLVHHGSGPKHTNLLDPDFPGKVAAYAQQVASRFPHVEDYTPVNEPLTTARFSALYGHWYPHHRDEHSFACAVLNQCRAVVLAMDAIRRINPRARLVQTDDLGKIYSTPALAYQAEFENERRWCTYDLLCGQFDRSHPMWGYFRRAGIPESELEWFLDHPCPPNVIGLNHYLSGERFLDEHVDRYAPDSHGGNGKHHYADVLAARVLRDGTPGPHALLMEAWHRYHRPIAITECHNGCTREEQLRWFVEVWSAAEKAREQGAEVVAVTAWSLLGAFDWNHLVTKKNDHYEPGVFDIRSSPPRPTALAGLIRRLAHGEDVRDPVLQVPGWWRRPRRFIYGISVNAEGQAQPAPSESINDDYPDARPVLITGGDGALARAFARICGLRGIPYRCLPRPVLDITNAVSVRRALLEHRPWAIINAAGYTRVDDAELQAGPCFRDNTVGAHLLARECEQRNIRFVTFSSDLVFDGNKNAPYVERDARLPLSVYGNSKAEAEKLVEQAMPSALIVRAGVFFSPWDESNFVIRALKAFAAGQPFRAANDIIVSPTYVPDLVNACLDLLVDAENGIWHVANVGRISLTDLAERAASLMNVSVSTLQSRTFEQLHRRATLPRFSALASERATLMPSLEDALARFVNDCEIAWRVSEEASEELAA